MSANSEWFECPHCGAKVPMGASACPECGSDESTGWAEDARPGGFYEGEDSFDYDDYVRREFGEQSGEGKPIDLTKPIVVFVLIVALFLVFVFA